MVHSSLLPYTFLIVGHIEANGKRETNAFLSQRRADAIRDILVNTFKISAKRMQSVGLGEEQLLDSARPTAPVNNQIQIMTLAKIPESERAGCRHGRQKAAGEEEEIALRIRLREKVRSPYLSLASSRPFWHATRGQSLPVSPPDCQSLP